MRFFMAALTFALVAGFLPSQGFAATVYVRPKPVNTSVQNTKKPVKK